MQRILIGINSLAEALKGSIKVLLVCDSSFPFLSIKNDIERIEVPYITFDQFTSNPLYEDVCKGVDLFQSAQCDTILAVGGGSSLDVAKCIKLYCQMDKDKLYLEQEYKDTGVKLVAIPTTAGTGSESTRYAVIYFDGKKQSVTHDSIIPDVAILESRVLKTLPDYQKKCTMMDALCQGIESWWSLNSTGKSKDYSKKTVELIMSNWRKYILDNDDEAAAQIMLAANYSGRAINITQTTAPHAMSYKLTSLYGLPHGHAVAICLPEVWTYMITHTKLCIDQRGMQYLYGVFADIAQTLGFSSLVDAIEFIRFQLKEMKLDNPKTSCREKDIEILTNSVNPIRLKNNPIPIDKDTLRQLYQTIITD